MEARCRFFTLSFDTLGVFPAAQRPWGKLCGGILVVLPSLFPEVSPLDLSRVFVNRSFPMPIYRIERSFISVTSWVWYVFRVCVGEIGRDKYVLQNSFKLLSYSIVLRLLAPSHNTFLVQVPKRDGDFITLVIILSSSNKRGSSSKVRLKTDNSDRSFTLTGLPKSSYRPSVSRKGIRCSKPSFFIWISELPSQNCIEFVFVRNT